MSNKKNTRVTSYITKAQEAKILAYARKNARWGKYKISLAAAIRQLIDNLPAPTIEEDPDLFQMFQKGLENKED